MIATSAVIYPNVELGVNVRIEDFCIIGCPYQDYSGEKTIIGDHSVIRSGTTIYAGNIIGSHFMTGNKVNLRELNNIGDNVSVGTLSVIEHHIRINSGARLHSQVFVPEYTILYEECWIGPNVVFTNAIYPKHPNVKNELKGAVVGKNAKIGANSTLLPSVVIGKNSLVGAGSVVTKDVPEGMIVAGNPAKPIREIHY